MREELARSLDWGHAHADFEKAVAGLAPELRGRRVHGLPHSAWEILEHLRVAQHDILDFARNPKYEEMKWPDEYWPASPEPPNAGAWDKSVAAFTRDREAVKQLATDRNIDLDARIPHGTGQTYLREVLLVLDHNAYHVGELVLLRRLLGAWPPRT
jgi:uncharacterized damage-inducible protein DinB